MEPVAGFSGKCQVTWAKQVSAVLIEKGGYMQKWGVERFLDNCSGINRICGYPSGY